MNQIKIGILGFGNVGQGVYKILMENKDYIFGKVNTNFQIKKILVRDLNKVRDIDVPQDVYTDNVDEIIEDDEIQIILELMGGEDFAKNCIIRSFNKGKHVISANKMCIAGNMDELMEVANNNNVMFKFEASVAGGIPIINGINTSLTANKIESFLGIVNGTTNYILTKMYEEDCTLEAALKEAKALGYAEEDPTSDVENFDAMYKLKILTKLCFGYNGQNIYREGITNIKKTDIEYAKELGYIIKSLAIAKTKNNKLELRVHPAMLKKNHVLAHVNDSFNALLIKGNAVGELMFYGRGAGDLPTGSAVVADLISITQSMELDFIPKETFISNDFTEQEIWDNESAFYIRIRIKDEQGVLASITGELAKNNISVSSIIQKEGSKEKTLNLVLVTHNTKEGNISNFISNIEKLPWVVSVRNVIRIEN